MQFNEFGNNSEKIKKCSLNFIFIDMLVTWLQHEKRQQPNKKVTMSRTTMITRRRFGLPSL